MNDVVVSQEDSLKLPKLMAFTTHPMFWLPCQQGTLANHGVETKPLNMWGFPKSDTSNDPQVSRRLLGATLGTSHGPSGISIQ